MEETKVPDLYKKGFNHGYVLSKNMPEILKGMQTPSNEPGEYTKGFQDGRKQFEKERGLERNYLNKEHQKDRDLGRER